MKRIVFTAPRTVELEEVSVPEPGEGRILVRVRTSGISAGTEMTYYRGAPGLRLGREEYTYPIRPGYEAVGIVEKCGPGVTGFRPGDRVLCAGYHAEYVEVEAGFSVHLPENVPDELGTLGMLTVTSAHAVRRAALEYGDRVVVIGLGVVGILAARQARLAGAGRVIGVERDPWRLEAARALGIDPVVDAGKEGALQAILDATGGAGADAVIEAAGVPGAIDDALRCVRDRGRIVILGYHTRPFEFHPGEEFWYKEVDLRAARAMGPTPGLPLAYTRWTADRSLEWAVELLAGGTLNLGAMVTHRFPCTAAARAYQMIDQHSEDFLQAVFTWDPA